VFKWAKKVKNQNQANRLLVNPFRLRARKRAGVFVLGGCS